MCKKDTNIEDRDSYRGAFCDIEIPKRVPSVDLFRCEDGVRTWGKCSPRERSRSNHLPCVLFDVPSASSVFSAPLPVDESSSLPLLDCETSVLLPSSSEPVSP